MTGKISSNPFTLRLLIIMIMCLFTFAVWSEAVAATKPAQGDVLARWGKKIITKEDLDLRISQYPPDLKEKLKDPAQRQQYLESLVQIQIAGTEAKAQKLDKRKAVAMRIDDAVNSILVQEYINDILKKIKKPTDEEAEAFFAANKNNYVSPLSIRAQHILIELKPDAKPEDIATAEAKAKKVYDELVAGGDFGKLAEKYSDDPESKTKGGDLGTFNAEQMAPEFSKPLLSMKKDELSRPFRTSFGFHIVKVNDLIPARQMELKDVKEDVLMQLDNQQREKLVYEEMERLKKKYRVTIY
ncbi:MAG: peptidylprolyl isomerase [Deltaproteobacteria bacterium]